MPSTTPARGMRDFLPRDVRRREFVLRVVRDTYERYGFQPLETPAVENIETLLGKYGEEGNQLIFKILKRGEHEASGQADLALRYDLTVPLSRVVAEHHHALPKFFKRYQIQPVWRADRPARGRFREFYQCDVDAIGSTSPVVEAELCAAACEVLQRLGFADVVLRLNHRALLTGVLDTAGIPADRHADALVALDKLDKIGAEGVRAEYQQRGLSAEAADTVLRVLGPGDPAESAAPSEGDDEVSAANERTLARLAAFVGDHEGARDALATLRRVLTLAACTAAGPRLRIDPSLARGLSYYTGCIMEMAVPDLAGSLGGGGRYDNLVGMFGKTQVPAAGFSLGLERLLVVMGEREMFPEALDTSASDVMVAIWWDARANDADRSKDEGMERAVAIAQQLRQLPLRVEVYPQADKLDKQFRYASALGVRFVVLVGDDEAREGVATLKDLASGQQTRLPRGEAASHIHAALGP